MTYPPFNGLTRFLPKGLRARKKSVQIPTQLMVQKFIMIEFLIITEQTLKDLPLSTIDTAEFYVVKVPRTVCAIFNEASEQATNKSRYDFKLAAGYCYKWFEPPDSKPIPYSKAIELQERALGDQTKPRHIKSMISTLASRLIRPAPPSPF